jgi:hypothetical protein
MRAVRIPVIFRLSSASLLRASGEEGKKRKDAASPMLRRAPNSFATARICESVERPPRQGGLALRSD